MRETLGSIDWAARGWLALDLLLAAVLPALQQGGARCAPPAREDRLHRRAMLRLLRPPFQIELGPEMLCAVCLREMLPFARARASMR